MTNDTTPTTIERRTALLAWISERPQHDGLTAREIVLVSNIYNSALYGSDRCFDDLKVLASRGQVQREGKPARWYAITNTNFDTTPFPNPKELILTPQEWTDLAYICEVYVLNFARHPALDTDPLLDGTRRRLALAQRIKNKAQKETA